MQRSDTAASHSGGSLMETDDREQAMQGAHVVYAKSWSATSVYGDTQADLDLRAGLTGWTVDSDWFDNAHSQCIFMHCLPVRREVVVTGDVLEGPRSRVIRQARNRMYAQMAVLHRLLADKGD